MSQLDYSRNNLPVPLGAGNGLGNHADPWNAGRAVEEETGILQNIWNSFRQRWLLAVGILSAVMGTVSYLTLQQTPIYEAEGKLLLRRDRASALAGVSDKTGQPEIFVANPLNNQVLIVKSAPVVESALKKINQKLPPSRAISTQEFLLSMNVQIVTGSDVLQVVYRGPDPQQASENVNQLMEAYILNDVLTNRAQAASARLFILEQLPKTELDVTRVEADLRRFKEKNQVVVLEQEAKTSLALMGELEAKIAATRAEIASSNAQFLALKQQLGVTSQQAIALSKLSESKVVQDALRGLLEVERALATQRTLYTGEHYSVARLERQKAAAQTLLQERVMAEVGTAVDLPAQKLEVGSLELSLMNDLVKTENRLTGLNTNLRSLEQAYQTYRNRLSFIPELEQTQRILERKLGVSQSTYEGLLKRLQEVQITENQTIGTARVLSPATSPTIPVSPKIAISLLQGGALGLALAIITLIVLESTDTMIRTSERAREIYGYLVLAILPNVSKKLHANPAVYVRDNPRAPIGEAYRMLQGSLRFLRSQEQLKAIAVTSAIAAEGKSTVSSNLATTMAQLGRRVLLVDADMRRPSQHSAWQIGNERGLSNVLVGECTLDQAIKSVIPNLFVLPAGVIPPDPVAILDSGRMAQLIESWTESYDFVIIDTPPILAVIDALLIAKLLNGLLLVARPGALNIKSATRAKTVLNQSGVNVLGMVTNDASGDDSNYYMYNYYYTSVDTPGLPAVSENAGGLTFVQRGKNQDLSN